MESRRSCCSVSKGSFDKVKVIHTIVETIIYPETSGKKIQKNKQAYEIQTKNINFATQHTL